MARFVEGIRRVPAWVWLLLASTQVLTIVAATSKVIELGRGLAEMPEGELYQGVRDGFTKILWNNQVDVVLATVFFVVFVALAAVRLIGRSRPQVKMPN